MTYIKELKHRTITVNGGDVARYKELHKTGAIQQYEGADWVVTRVETLPGDLVAHVEFTEFRRVKAPTPSGMQYIVVQGRQPQDGSKPQTALVIFPAWVSPTLMCAGVAGRVIELTDGSICESGALIPDEASVLEVLREQERVGFVETSPTTRAEGMEPPATPPAKSAGEITPADYAELRDRVKELTDVNHQQQCELERLRGLLGKIRKSVKMALKDTN